MLLTWLLNVLLALLNLSLALIGCGMHAGAATISLGAGLVAVAAHGGAGPVASEPASARCIVTDLMLNPAVAADQAVIAVAASVRARPAGCRYSGCLPRWCCYAIVVIGCHPLLLFRFPLLLLLLLFLLMVFLVMYVLWL